VKKALILLSLVLLLPVSAIAVLKNLPRPADTTEARVFSGDGAQIDYCDLRELDGSGRRADEIPVAYTPGCGWDTFPMPVLADCGEPLASGASDLRGLWLAYSGAEGHVERIEQCGDRVVVTSAGVIHDIRTDGTLAGGANDVGPGCLRIRAAGEWVEGRFHLRPFGGPFALVKRRLEGDELVWDYPALGTVRMRRICQVPPG